MRGWLVVLLGAVALSVLALGPAAVLAAEPPAGAESISAGGSHTCAIKVDKTLTCWGDDSSGQVSGAPEGEFSAVAAGGAHSCAIGVDGTLACWGDDSSGQVSGAPEGEFSAVAAGGAHSCAIKVDKTLTCWGDDSSGQVSGAPEGEFSAVAAGGAHSCAIRVDATLVCWGDDSSGQVSGAPQPSGHWEREWDWHWHWPFWHWHWHWVQDDPPKFLAVSAGGADTCAIGVDKTLACWGDDSSGQVSGAPEGEFSAVAAGGAHSCALRVDGTLACWGDDSSGQVSGAPEGEFSAVAAGGAHSCALRVDGQASCWGSNEDGQVEPLMIEAKPPSGVTGTPYLHQFATTPQAPDPTFSFTAGSLPDGLALSAGGKLSGTPTKAGTFAFTVLAANGVTPDAALKVTLKIAAAPKPPAPAVAAPPAPDPGLPPPTAGLNVNIAPVEGTVAIRCPSDAGFVRLPSPEQIPLTCQVDANRGTAEITAAKGNEEGTQSARFWGGTFGLGQKAANNWITELELAGRLKCEKSKGASKSGRVSKRRRNFKRGKGGGRKLWGSGKGNYTTSGSYGSATVRGTTWLVQDRCDSSTFFAVREGVVTVNDFVKGTTISLYPGDTYLAKAAIPRLR